MPFQEWIVCGGVHLAITADCLHVLFVAWAGHIRTILRRWRRRRLQSRRLLRNHFHRRCLRSFHRRSDRLRLRILMGAPEARSIRRAGRWVVGRPGPGCCGTSDRRAIPRATRREFPLQIPVQIHRRRIRARTREADIVRLDNWAGFHLRIRRCMECRNGSAIRRAGEAPRRRR